nr:hypothetical protein [Tanacetum cinerariifolium]
MIRAQVGDLSSHSTKYSSPALTQKVFANMRRVGKGLSRVDTPLFEGMIVAQHDDDVANEGVTGVDVDAVPAAVEEPSIPSPTPTTQPPPPSQDLPFTSQVLPTPPPSPIAQPPSPQQQPQPSQPSHNLDISVDLLHTLLETCTTLTRRVEHLEQDKIAQTLEITKLKQRVKKLEMRNKLKVSKLRRLKRVGTAQRVDTSEDTVMDDVSKQGRGISANIDADEDVTLNDVSVAKDVADVEKDDEIEESADVQGRQAKSQAQIHQIDLEHADKVLSIGTITAATTSITIAAITTAPSAGRRREGAKFNSNVAFLEKTREQTEKEDSKALKRISESQAEKAAKKQKLDEEVEERKKHLQIVPNDEDDVYTEATPLALKVPVVDYAIHTENNKPYFKIIRERNFDREDLEVLWQLVKERFSSSKPKNFSDDFLLTTLTYMFDKPNVEDQVWKSQRGIYGLVKVKIWKLLESCRVHIITLTTTQMILLVERRYPLTRFTLDQMLNNVRLEVEEESEVSLELLRFVRQQQQEGFRPE